MKKMNWKRILPLILALVLLAGLLPAAVFSEEPDPAEGTAGQNTGSPASPDPEQQTRETPEKSSEVFSYAFKLSLEQEGVEVDAEGRYKVTVPTGIDYTTLIPEGAVFTHAECSLFRASGLTFERIEDAEVDADGILTFTTENFGLFVLLYTAHYREADSGETHTLTMPVGSSDRFEVTVTYDDAAGIPADADLSVSEISAESDEYKDYLEKTAAKLGVAGEAIPFARFFDIDISSGDEKIEPEGGVTLHIQLKDLPADSAAAIKAVHFTKDGVEVLDIQQMISKESGEVEIIFEAASFSVYGVIVPSSTPAPKEYMVIVKHNENDEDKYYIVLNDGTLTGVAYDEENGSVTVDNPMLWYYTGDHLYHDSTQVGYTYQDLPSDSYYRYIDPSSESGLNEDDASNTTNNGVASGSDAGPKITSRSLWGQTALSYTANKLRSNSDQAYYIGVVREGGVLKLKGKVRENEAATVFFADAVNVKSVDWKNHTVNHIDISISGTAAVDVPLAYGRYYDASHNVVMEVSDFQKIHLGEAQVVDSSQLVITPDDMKRSSINAYLANGETLNDAFYVSGYSANPAHEESSAQVRIEGSFQVANLGNTDYAPVDKNRYKTDNGYKNAVHEARLQNRVYYSVTVIKPITFRLEMQDPEDSTKTIQLYDADGTPLTITADVAFSASFDYWDERNECPPIHDSQYGYNDQWQTGGIPDHNMSGMDFKLGADTETTAKVYAVEITKIVVDENGNRIRTDDAGTNKFYIYKNSDGVSTRNYEEALTSYVQPEYDNVKDLDVGSFTQAPDYSGYTLQHEKTISVGSEGLGLVYDYDVQPGRYFVKEDPASIANEITDTSGKTWEYKNTYILTEYAWRNHANDNYMHVSDTFTKNTAGEYADSDYSSIPEILGLHYGYNGTDGPYTNDFLEFYVYNVYESPKVDVPVIKTWEDFEDDQYNWQATFKLQWAPLYPDETRPNVAFQDVTPVQTMTISKSDMDGITQDLITCYLSGDTTLTQEQISKIEAITFKDLPKNGTDTNGNTFRYQYSLEETSYRVTNAATGVVIYSWSELEGYNDAENGHYVPYYPHDAGETEEGHTDDENEADTNYYVRVVNAPKTITQNDYIDVDIEKQWDLDSSGGFDERQNEWYAEFELRRFVHTEYRDLSHMSDADKTAEPITITIKSEDTVIHTLQVQPNVGLYLAGNFAPHDSAKSVTFTADHPVRLANGSAVTTITATAEGHNMSNALVRSPEFFATQDTVFTISGGAENLVSGNPAKVLDTGAGTNPLPDRSFSQTIRLDSTNSWKETLSQLIHMQATEGDDDNENVTYYEYYFVEKAGNPKGYAQYFRADSSGNITEILSGDSDHQIEHSDSIIALNGPSNRLIVKKLWRGVPDSTGFPAVTFTLYQAWADGNDGWVYENTETHARYEHIELKGNSLEWICPEVLPATRLDGSTSRAVKYYIQEDNQSGSQTEGGVTTSWQFYYYLNSKGQQTNAGHQGYFAALTGRDLSADGGTITICNKMNNYMQLDIQKQYFKMEESGSWNNVTATSDMMSNAILGFKVIRAVKAPDGKWLDAAGNESDTPVWMDYSEEMLCGYDENGQAVVHRGENDIFWLHNAGGDWHFRIEDNQGDANNVSAGGSGLPGYGFFIRNGEDITVEYWYSFRETNVYKDLDRTPYPEWDWFSSITPVTAHGPNGQTMEAFPKAFSGQDSNRIANFQASDLIVDKEWLGDPAATAVYVKIWRTAGDGAPEDFTAVIAEDIRSNNNWQMYLTDPTEIDLNRNCLILRPDSTGIWEDAIKVNRALLGTLAETGRYRYYIQEVGYRNAAGEYRTNVNGQFRPFYDKWVGTADTGSYTGTPVGMNDYANNNITIGSKGENRLKVINSTEPSTSYTVTKAFHGPQSSTGGQSSVTGRYPSDGSAQVVVTLQQRYRYEKTEDGVDYVSADNVNWVRADSENAATTWTQDWQAAESANPVRITLPQPKPEGSTFTDDAWYGSAAAWTYTWEGLDLVKSIPASSNPEETVYAQLYYRAVEETTPGWFRSVIAAEEQNGHKAIDDGDQDVAGVLSEKNNITNERQDCSLELNKEWTGLGTGETWPEGYVVYYQLIQNYHLAAAGVNGDTATYSYGDTIKSVDMVTSYSEGLTADSVHPQATGTLEESNHNLKLTGLPMYGFFTATQADVEAAAEKGVTLTAGTVYPVVYTYSVKETAVKKNGTDVGFREQTVDAVLKTPAENADGEENLEGEGSASSDERIYKATLTNSLTDITVRKEWNGLTPGAGETATIGLYRFKKDADPIPETSFRYTVAVTGDTDALNSEGTVRVVIYDAGNQEVGTYTLRKNNWSHTFILENGGTYHAVFEGDGTVLNSEISPSSNSDITGERSIELTAEVKPTASGSVKLVITGKPNGLWMNPLQDSDGHELIPQKSWSPHYFNGESGETGALDGLMPGASYRFQIGGSPSSVDGATYNGGFVTFTAVDGLKTITLNFSSGGGETPQTTTFDPTTTTVSSGIISGQYGSLIHTNPLVIGTEYEYNLQVRNLATDMLQQYSVSVIGGTYRVGTVEDYYNGESGRIQLFITPTDSESPIKIDVTFGTDSHSMQSPSLKTQRSLAGPTLRAPTIIEWTNSTALLPEGADPDNDELIDTVTFSGATWSKTWSDLDSYSADGKEYVYYVYETDYSGVSGATALDTTYSIEADGTLVVTNTPTYPEVANLKVEKELLRGGAINTNANDLSITVGLFTDSAGTIRVSGQGDKTITISEGKGEVTFTGLEAGTYYVFEINADGDPVINSESEVIIDEVTYTVTYTGNGSTVSVGTTSTVTIKNEGTPYSLNLVKIEENHTEIPLSGAIFQLNKLQLNNDNEIIGSDSVKHVMTVSPEGTAAFTELGFGCYEIRETKAPNGYLLSNESTFYIKVTGSGISLVKREGDTIIDPVEPINVSGLVTFVAEPETETFTATVGNTPGTELPATGGIGTHLSSFLGAILMLASGVILMLRRKKTTA